MAAEGAVFVTGATGLIGGRLCRELAADGIPVIAHTRRPGGGSAEEAGVRWVSGDLTGDEGPSSETGGSDWRSALGGASAVVHLAGEPVAARRWSAAQKARLVDSRVDSTRRIVSALRDCGDRPPVFVCASAIGFYGPRGDELVDEGSAPGDDFLARLCTAWEAEARAAESLGMRVVLIRFGVVLSHRGGALDRMLLPFRLGLGGPVGPAGRWFSWIHEDDAVELLRETLRNESLRGPVNAVAPGAVRMGEFASSLGRALSRPAILPVPLPLLRVALGELADGLVAGQRVAPAAAEGVGFRFRFPSLDEALADCTGG